MHTLDGLRRQIDTATDLSSVVTMMKTLAAVSIHQYDRAVEALADYSRSIELGFQVVLGRHDRNRFYPDSRTTTGQVAAVILGSDQGMCGQFNEGIVFFVNRALGDPHREPTCRILVVGVRAVGLLQDAGWNVIGTYTTPTSVSDINNLVQEILPQIDRLRTEANVAKLLIFHNRRTSASSFEPQRLQLLPLDPEQLARWRNEPWNTRSSPMIMTEPRRLLSRLVQQYLYVALFRACAESLASENASRIAAMQAAEKNIEERLDELRCAFNQLRQSAITEELLEVVTGFEALSQERT